MTFSNKPCADGINFPTKSQPILKTNRATSLKSPAGAGLGQKNQQIEDAGNMLVRLAAAMDVDPRRVFVAIRVHGHPGLDGENLDKALGLPLGSAARAMRSITGGAQ